MAIARHTREHKLARQFDDNDEKTLYWLTEEGKVMYRHYPLRGADPETFRFYLGSFGKDAQHCYSTSRKLTGAQAKTFHALNYTYATDGKGVWTKGGPIADVDAKSFRVCDDGVYGQAGGRGAPQGYAADKTRVYYYGYQGKPSWVRKADPATFVSLNDGQFGHDEQHVFFGQSTIAKAKVAAWKMLGSNYSADDQRVFYFNREITGADRKSFRVVKHRLFMLAHDGDRYYWNGEVISLKKYDELRKKK